jgi:hypothetical protein
MHALVVLVSGWLSAAGAGDSRGGLVLDAAAGGQVDGHGCRLVDAEIATRFDTLDGPRASLEERLELCAFDVGVLDPRLHHALSLEVEPRLSDRLEMRAGTYTRLMLGGTFHLFDLRAFMNVDSDPETIEALEELLGPSDHRVIPLPFTIKITRTSQDELELRDVEIQTAFFRWLKRGRTIDFVGLELHSIDAGAEVGVAMGSVYAVRVTNFELGRHLAVDAELGAKGTGTMSGSSGTVTTPEPLYGMGAGVGRLELRGRFARGGFTLAGERAFYPTMELGLALDTRASGQVDLRLGRTTLSAHGFGARTQRTAADGATSNDLTYGGGLMLAHALPHRLTLVASAELARSFYATLPRDHASPAVAPGARALVSLRMDLGQRP